MALLTQQGISSGFAGQADIGQERKGQSLQLPGQTLDIATFLSSAKLRQGPGMGALPQETN